MKRQDILGVGIAIAFITIWAVGLSYEGHQKQLLLDKVKTAADDLGCAYIEQSYKNPNNFYIDCGNDEIRIIKQSNE